MAPETDLNSQIESSRKLFGLSNFYTEDGDNLGYAKEDLEPEINGQKNIIIIAYAPQTIEATTALTKKALERLGARSIYATHQYSGEEQKMVEDASVIYITGGNTYDLVVNLEGLKNEDGTPVDPRPQASRNPISESIRRKAAEGTPIIGISAGLLVLFEDIRGSDDVTSAVQSKNGSINVPIKGLGLMPNHLRTRPHYADSIDEVLTKEEREAAVKFNPNLKLLFKQLDERSMPRDLKHVLDMDASPKTIIALRDNTYFVVRGGQMTLKGEDGAVIFRKGWDKEEIKPVEDISYLLKNG